MRWGDDRVEFHKAGVRRAHPIWKKSVIRFAAANARKSPRTPRSGVAIEPSSRNKNVPKDKVSNNSFGRPVAWKKMLKFQKNGRKIANGIAHNQTLSILRFHVGPSIGSATN